MKKQPETVLHVHSGDPRAAWGSSSVNMEVSLAAANTLNALTPAQWSCPNPLKKGMWCIQKQPSSWLKVSCPSLLKKSRNAATTSPETC